MTKPSHTQKSSARRCTLRIAAPLSLLCALLTPACSRRGRDGEEPPAPATSSARSDAATPPSIRPAAPPPDAAPAVRSRGDGPPVHAADAPIVELTRRLYDRVLASLPTAEVAGAGAWLRGEPDYHGVRFGWVAQRRRDGSRATVQAFLLRGARLRYADLGGYVGRLEPDPMGLHPQEFPLRSTGAPGLAPLVAASERVRVAALDGQCELPMVQDGESPAMPGAAARVRADCATTQAVLRARVGLSPSVSVSALYPAVDGQRLEVVGTVQWQGADWAVTYASAHRVPVR